MQPLRSLLFVPGNKPTCQGVTVDIAMVKTAHQVRALTRAVDARVVAAK